MAERLLKYYKFASDEGGLELKMKLAMATKLPSADAARIADTPDKLTLFRETLKKLTGKAVPEY